MPASNNVVTDLFAPIQLGALSLANRMVLAPLTRNRAGAGNVPQALNASYYEQRASAGLIISEASQISPQVAGWKQVTEAVHKRGGRLFLQLWHVGRISHPSLQADNDLPVAPSPIRPQGDAITYEGLRPFETPRALETDERPLMPLPICYAVMPCVICTSSRET